MNFECRYCKALYFKDEPNVRGAYKSCCRFGRTRLQENAPYPHEIKNLFASSRFMKNIRAYNAALSFASMGGNCMESTGRGPYCFKLHAQMYHSAYNMYPAAAGNERYGQLYVLDGETACDIRSRRESNQDCDPAVMFMIDAYIRSKNTYAIAYFNMSEIERNARRNRTFVDELQWYFIKITKNKTYLRIESLKVSIWFLIEIQIEFEAI